MSMKQHRLLDCTFVITELKRKRPPHGIPRVILAYLRHYSEHLKLVYRLRGKLFIISSRYSKQLIPLILSWNPKHYPKIVSLLIKAYCFAEKPQKTDHYFLFKLDQGGMKYPGYFQEINNLGIKSIIMIHDLFPITHPEYSDPRYAKQFESNVRLSLHHAQGIICVSQNTQDILKGYSSAKQLALPQTIAANLAPGVETQPQSKQAPLKEPYFVIISTIVARKNHLLLLHIWRKLVNELHFKAPKLVIIGQRSSECTTTLALLDRCQQLKQHVIEITANDEELTHYLSHARALLFPTFAEGYGLPLIEALATQVPVICSDLVIFREIAQHIPDYLDPTDGKAWLELILDYAQEHSPKRAAQMERLSQFIIPNWNEHFNKVDAFLEHLV